jgi:hypothetical protein
MHLSRIVSMITARDNNDSQCSVNGEGQGTR